MTIDDEYDYNYTYDDQDISGNKTGIPVKFHFQINIHACNNSDLFIFLCSNEANAEEILCGGVLCALAIFGIIGNSLSIIVFLKLKKSTINLILPGTTNLEYCDFFVFLPIKDFCKYLHTAVNFVIMGQFYLLL